MSAERPISVLLGALGGQGGGVLADWLVEAAEHAGYPAQATSTPGVAQRTGATTYYFELFPEKSPDTKPIFALFPSTDDVDLVAALEPTEAGRAMERGHVTDRTTVITAGERMYSTAEKVAAGDGTIAARPVLEAVDKAAKSLIALNMKEINGGNAQKNNAILFGAIAESGVLPLDVEDCRTAIEMKGVAITPNLEGFEIGRQALREGGNGVPLPPGKTFNLPPSGFDDTLSKFPDPLRPLIGHGLGRLADYQDRTYAQLYLDRLALVDNVDPTDDKKIVGAVAGHLAAWMSYEDVIRVAQLKTRSDRFPKICKELGIEPGVPLHLVDFFKPGREESLGIFPQWLIAMIPKGREQKVGQGKAIKWPTTSAWGYAILKIMAALRPIRPHGVQFAEEQEKISNWLSAVRAAATVDVSLAVTAARLAIWSRGYGDVRREGQERLQAILTNWSDRLSSNLEELKVEADQMLILAHANPELESGPH